VHGILVSPKVHERESTSKVRSKWEHIGISSIKLRVDGQEEMCIEQLPNLIIGMHAARENFEGGNLQKIRYGYLNYQADREAAQEVVEKQLAERK
jgi:hypothetical protein